MGTYTCEDCREVLSKRDIWSSGGKYYCDLCDWELNNQSKAASVSSS